VTRSPFHLSKSDETFEFSLGFTPVAGLLDPDHDMLREIPALPWQQSELLPIFQFAPSCLEREEAFRRLVRTELDEATIRLMAKVFAADNDLNPAFANLTTFGELARPELRLFWLDQLNHPNFQREAQAVAALGLLPADPGTTAKLRALINGKAPIPVVIAALRDLAKWDAKGNIDVIKQAESIPSKGDRIKELATSLAGSG
jgi:hypothetical protein